MQLLIGCGKSREKRIVWRGCSEWDNLVTLDINSNHGPDIVHDLNQPLPIQDNTCDEIHAYEVLEHCGKLGDYKFFFGQWSDFWRVLKPGGKFMATVPSLTSPWLFGDPSHTRAISLEQLTFLHQPSYEQVGKTAMSDFRNIYKEDFDIEFAETHGDTFSFVLSAVKPSRCVYA